MAEVMSNGKGWYKPHEETVKCFAAQLFCGCCQLFCFRSVSQSIRLEKLSLLYSLVFFSSLRSLPFWIYILCFNNFLCETFPTAWIYSGLLERMHSLLISTGWPTGINSESCLARWRTQTSLHTLGLNKKKDWYHDMIYIDRCKHHIGFCILKSGWRLNNWIIW